MQTIQLKNGLKLIFKRRKTNSITIQILVNAGSNNEKKSQAGISHFIEHMVFEGTKNKENSRQIANEIEKLGGEFNAYTSNEKTCFFIKILKKHFSKASEILSDLLLNPLFREEDIKKQREIILKEVNLVNDEPRFYQWILFNKTLFQKHPLRNPTYGTKKAIKKITKKQILKYYQEYYCGKNMVVSVVGDLNFKKIKKQIKKDFSSLKKGHIAKKTHFMSKQKKISKKEFKDTNNTYFVLGYKTKPRSHNDSYIFDIIDAILGRGQSGWLFDEIRAKHALAYEVTSNHLVGKDFGYFAVNLSTDYQRIKLAKKLIFEQFKNLQNLTQKQLKEAKTYIEGNFKLETEDTREEADEILSWAQASQAQEYEKYLKKIKKITLKEVKNTAQKYLNKKYCQILIVPQKEKSKNKGRMS